MDVEFVERDLRQVLEVGRDLAGHRIGSERADQLRVDPEPVGDQEEAVLVARLRFADVDRPDQRSVERAEWIAIGPDLRVVGAFAGPSEPKFASSSVQARWPSAASGLIVSPSGRVTIADSHSDGVVARPSVLGIGSVMSSPEAESASVVVGAAKNVGWKVSFSHSVIGG